MNQLKFFSFVLIFAVFFSEFANSQHDHSKCLTNHEVLEALESDSTPYYLRDGFGEVRTTSLAIVYIDFPDGRYIENGISKQPLNNSQLANVQNFDATGEVGVVNFQTPYPVGDNKYIQAAKYKWKDRWNAMFSQGIYYGNAHPDWASHGDSAYGSFFEYWKEVSNDKFLISPALTHPNETNQMFRTGIINNYTINSNGDTIISYITLPLNKYGLNENVAYFPDTSHYSFSYDNGDISRAELMMHHTKIKLQELYNLGIIHFNVSQFLANNGTLMIVFAGGHKIFKGIAELSPIGGNFIVRSNQNHIYNPESRYDGLSIAAHEFAHCNTELHWGHVNASQFCIMNVYDRHHKDSALTPKSGTRS